MKKKNLLIAFVLVTSGLMFSTIIFKNHTKSYFPRENKEAVQERDAQGAIDWYTKIRANQITGKIDVEDVLKAQEDVRAFRLKKGNKNLGTTWKEMGPDNIGGRTRAILIDKDNHDRIFAGGVSGGLWKSETGGSSWFKVEGGDQWENLTVVSICQTSNGDIYVGTGEGMYTNYGSGTGGLPGKGIWKSTDHGTTWAQLSSTTTTDFTNVNKLAAHPTNSNTIFAATKKGLRVTKDGGSTWIAPISIVYGGLTKESSDVKIASDGTVICSLDNKAFISTSGDSGTFVKKSATLSTTYKQDSLINPSSGRLEFAFAPSDPNYIYCSSSNPDGTIENIYRSTDKGNHWVIIGAGGNDLFQPFRNQGTYDNVIAVYPNNKNMVLLGGIDLWKWEEGDIFKQLTLWSFDPGNPFYIHADLHTIVFHPDFTTNGTFYVGCDGGIFKSTDAGTTFSMINKKYNVTQCYSISCSPDGKVVMGCQDNGTVYIDFNGNSDQAATDVGGGDGGYTFISVLNPKAMFTSVYYGALYRSEDYGATSSSFYSASEGSFVTNFRVWESFHDIYSVDSIDYIITLQVGDTLVYGDTLMRVAKSKINEKPIPFTYTYLPANISDTLYPGAIINVRVQDYYQAMLALGLTNKIVLSRKPLDFSQTQFATSCTNISGTVSTLEFSRNGEILYAATDEGKLYRVDSLQFLRYIDSNTPFTNKKAELIADFNYRSITSIAIDPNDAGKVLVTLGNFGNTNYIYYCDSADVCAGSAGNFTLKQGDLPAMPVFSSVIVWNDSKKVLVGTEYGIYSCSDITASSPVWEDESTSNSGLGNVATYMLYQQVWPNSWDDHITNHGYIYAATHGRGAWRTETFKGPVAVPTIKEVKQTLSLSVYPNPASDYVSFNYASNSYKNINVQVYDLNGKMIKNFNKDLSVGNNKVTFPVSNLNKGNYFVVITDGTNKLTSKFIVL